MSAEIVSPFGRSAAPLPDEDVVERLRGLLEQAERGELNGLVWAVARPTGAIGYGFCTGTCNGNLLLAAAAMAYHDVMSAMNEVAS